MYKDLDLQYYKAAESGSITVYNKVIPLSPASTHVAFLSAFSKISSFINELHFYYFPSDGDFDRSQHPEMVFIA